MAVIYVCQRREAKQERRVKVCEALVPHGGRHKAKEGDMGVTPYCQDLGSWAYDGILPLGHILRGINP